MLRLVSLYFWVALWRLLLCHYGGATGFILKAHGSYRRLRDGYRIYARPLRLFCLLCPISSATLSLLRHFLPITTATAKAEINEDELNARTKVNGGQRGAHRDKDCLRDGNEHGFKFKHAQDAASDRY
jgi:hypothetical protein